MQNVYIFEIAKIAYYISMVERLIVKRIIFNKPSYSQSNHFLF